MQLHRDYERNGYLVVRHFFSSKEILRLTGLVDDIHGKWLEDNQDALVKHKLVNMHSLTWSEYFLNAPQQRRKFFEYISPLKLLEFLDELFEVPLHFYNSQLFFNPYDKAQLPYWHRDLQFSPLSEAKQRQALVDHAKPACAYPTETRRLAWS